MAVTLALKLVAVPLCPQQMQYGRQDEHEQQPTGGEYEYEFTALFDNRDENPPLKSESSLHT
jgi:hypothetical protein